ncbi:LuxR C-terminal-related transcriptional regulator [Neobacillus drentensis]|uniref:LuxR C-terminal-related transcriptional regulator n=1 Tax=Neobacillus drentensis TaxID=220684 RepID=UPI002FFEAA58
MKHKIEQLLMKGLSILLELREPFLKRWKHQLKKLNYQNDHLVAKFETIIELAFLKASEDKNLNVDSFIFSLFSEWQARFSKKEEEYESIFLLTTIEHLFHQLLANKSSATFLDHQAVQSIFSRILDQTFLTQNVESQNQKWLKSIISTNIVPIKWIAVVKKNQPDYQVETVVCSDLYPADRHLLDICTSLKAGEINYLSLAIQKLVGRSTDEQDIIKIPCINDYLLICPEDLMTEEQIMFIKGMYIRQLKLLQLESKMEWKDASLLFLQSLIRTKSVDDAVNAISKGLVDFMPFKRCALFLYNHFVDKGIGVSGYNVNDSAVQQIKEEIFTLPLIDKYFFSLTHSQPLYFSNASDILPKKFVQDYQLKSLVVLPIFVPTNSKLLGVAFLDQGADTPFTVLPETLTTLIRFGQNAGELLYSIWDEALQQFCGPQTILTLREKEVLQLIADGASISEAAAELHLSSYTVRDYVSSIIQKLAAKNRTDAAVKAIKMKLIS